MANVKTIFVASVTALAVLSLLASALVYGWLWRSLPVLKGEVTLPGLALPVNVNTGEHGIPLITAKSRTDAAQALGFVTARDRLFQMDLMRRKSAGRLAEIFGEPALENDIRSRTYGYNVEVKQIWSKLSVNHRLILQAYTDGVNGFLAQNTALPFEFDVLGYRPEPWRPEDCLLVVLGMFENLTAGAEQDERMVSVMASVLPQEAVVFLTPDSDPFTDSLLANNKSLRTTAQVPVAALKSAMSNTPDPKMALASGYGKAALPGSNAWAVSGAKTSDHRAILANDMHLGLSVPNIWYRAALNYPQTQATGVFLPGTPFLVVGSNQYLAWGLTSLIGDFLDLVKLELNPENSNQYRANGKWLTFKQRSETIAIKDDNPQTLPIKETIWGPVAQKPLLGRQVAIHWVALDVDAINTDLLDMEQSRTLEQALEVVNRAGNPQLNVLLADNHANIAWTLTGKIPKRQGLDGLISQSWADGKKGWTGYLQPAQMPRVINPEAGVLVSANERRFGSEFPFLIGYQFANGYRAFHIKQRLKAMWQHDEWSMFNLQLDSTSEFYNYYQQLALTLLTPEALTQKPALQNIKHYLLAWDGQANDTSSGFPVLVEFRQRLIKMVFTPFLAACKQMDNQFSYEWTYVDTPLQALLQEKNQELLPYPEHYRSWDDMVLDQLEQSVQAVLARHPHQALADITWGMHNQTDFKHPFSRALPALSALLDMPKQPLSGCGYCIRVASPEFGASERFVVSPGHLEQGLLHMPGGQSAHPLSGHYRDQQLFWLTGQALPLWPKTTDNDLQLKPPNTGYQSQSPLE